MLVVSDLAVRYGAVEALRGVSITAPAGEVTAVIGANGAGKSSLMRAIAGLVPITAGTVTCDGVDITGRPPQVLARDGLVLVPEGRSTIAELTVRENLELGGLIRSRAERKQRLGYVMDLFPRLAERSGVHADVLSGGERQQLAIGRALMSSPRYLLLDEPSLGLAPLIVTQILELVRDLARDTGLAVLLVEQNAATALRVAVTGAVLNLGSVVATGPARELAADSGLRHAYLGY